MKKIFYTLLLLVGFCFSAIAQIPTVSSFSPASGCSGSTTVTITGTNFTGATVVTFGGLAAQSFNVVNATQITAIPANGNTGTIAVTNPSGTGTSAGIFTVNISPAPPTLVTATPASMCMQTVW